ncbi:hypothetical protein [Amycolatopsis sp. cg9]|uniref:effector-associated domain 2-containing protein n=1 Tax=Amycolatopsis sp. cg9 TaxID=3238801 RepID=UPI003523C91F
MRFRTKSERHRPDELRSRGLIVTNPVYDELRRVMPREEDAMGRTWHQPDLPPGPLRTLNTALHQLHAKAGYPSVAQVARWIAHNWSEDGTGSRPFSTTTCHRALITVELPNRNVMLWVVAAFIQLGRIRNEEAILDSFEQLWQNAHDGTFHTTPVADAPPTSSESRTSAGSPSTASENLSLPGGQEFHRRLGEFVDQLFQFKALREADGRRLALQILTEDLEFSLAIAEHPAARPHLFAIVLACRKQPGALVRLLDIVDMMMGSDGPSTAQARAMLDTRPSPRVVSSTRDLDEVVDALERVPELRELAGRNLAIETLMEALGVDLGVEEIPITRPHISAIAKACIVHHPETLLKFAEAVAVISPNSKSTAFALEKVKDYTRMRSGAD